MGVENMFELNIDIAEYYYSALQDIIVELEDDFDYGVGVLAGLKNPDIYDIRSACMEYAFNEEYGYYIQSNVEIDGRFGLDLQVLNSVYEYLADNGCDTDSLFPVNREKIYNQYAYWYANQDMIADITFESLSKKILMLESLILKIYEENGKKKTIKNFAERMNIKSIINTKFGVGLVSDLIFNHYETEEVV